MDERDLELVCDEVRDKLVGRVIGRVFQLAPMALAIDFLPHAGVYLFVDYSPRHASTFLIRRKRREIERAAYAPNQFTLTLNRELQDRQVTGVEYSPRKTLLLGTSAVESQDLTVEIAVVNLSPNICLLDADEIVLASARPIREHVSESEAAPSNAATSTELQGEEPRSVSEGLDLAYNARTAGERFDQLSARARKKIGSEIAKRAKLISNLQGDLEKHGEPDEWKRKGDLLLANLGQLRRDGDRIYVTDFYDPDLREIEISGEHNLEPTEIASRYFKRYSKARNAQAVTVQRLETVQKEMEDLEAKRVEIASAIERLDEAFLTEYLGGGDQPQKPGSPKKKSEQETVKGVRRFKSSDGFEIWVGKKATDNDVLTFRLAKSLEYWLHAADYPGSHVIIRNPGRKDVPDRTLAEAAELAAFYSDGRSQVRATVRYTQRKFVHKPKRSAPGMVSLASFKTIYVEPRITIENLDARK